MKTSPEDAERWWVEADVNKDGALTVQELRTAVNACRRKDEQPEFDDQELCEMYMIFTDLREVMFTDAEGGGEHHFSRAMFISISGCDKADKISKEKYIEQMGMDRASDLKKFFKEVDVNSDGYLSHDEIRKLIQNAGLCEEAAEDILASADPDRDGKVTWEEFQKCV